MLIPAIIIAALLLSGCATFRPGFTGKPEVNVGQLEGGWSVSIKRHKGIILKKEF